MISNIALITYLRGKFADWDKPWSVDAAVNLFSAEDRSRLPAPCLYVSVSPITGEVSDDGGDYLQMVSTTIRVILVAATTQDRTGKQGQSTAHLALLDLIKALCGKKFVTGANEVYFFNYDFEKVDEARYFHNYEFRFTMKLDRVYIEDPESVDLEELYVTYNLVDATEDTQPNAEDDIDYLQD